MEVHRGAGVPGREQAVQRPGPEKEIEPKHAMEHSTALALLLAATPHAWAHKGRNLPVLFPAVFPAFAPLSGT